MLRFKLKVLGFDGMRGSAVPEKEQARGVGVPDKQERLTDSLPTRHDILRFGYIVEGRGFSEVTVRAAETVARQREGERS